jgi:hypothetical protein
VSDAIDPAARLDQLERTLDRARPAMDDAEQERIAAAALDDLFDIGLAVNTGRLPRSELQPVLDRTRDRLSLLDRGFFGVVVDGPAPLLNDIVFPDAWREVCTTRSGLQFAIDLYWDGRVPETLREDLEQFDHLLEQVGTRDAPLPPDEVPPGIQHSHWWWWVPYEDRPAR